MSCLAPDSSPVLCAMGMFSGRYFGILSLFRSFLGLVWFSQRFSVGGLLCLLVWWSCLGRVFLLRNP